MHPRNVYARPPDFARLCVAHEDLRKHCKLVANGKVHLDFSDDAAVRALTRALLKEDFNLEVDLPEGSLCPRVPQRLNYLLWIEDILVASRLDDDVVIGIDIGTGSSGIYALLGARRFGWSFVATEAEGSSRDAAQLNIDRNGLGQKIRVVKTEVDGPLIEDACSSHPSASSISFCMCNPPFFDGDGETSERFSERGAGQWENGVGGRKRGRDLPRSGTIASENELATEGGEVAFIGRLIEESGRLEGRIKVYTTMLGKKSSVGALKERLRRLAEKEKSLRFTSDELKQGRTQRWLLAWTFSEEVKLPEWPASIELPVKNKTRMEIGEWLREQFLSLRMEVAEGEGKMEGVAREATWLRKKKRRRKEHQDADSTEIEDLTPTFHPLTFTVSITDLTPLSAVFTIPDASRKRDLSQLVVHLSNKLIVNLRNT